MRDEIEFSILGNDGYYIGVEDGELCEKLRLEATRLSTRAEAEILLATAQKKYPTKTLEIVTI